MLFLDGQLRSVSVSTSSPWFSSFSWSSSADRLQNRSPGAKKFLSSPAPSSGFSHLNSARIMIPYQPAISRRISCNQWCLGPLCPECKLDEYWSLRSGDQCLGCGWRFHCWDATKDPCPSDEDFETLLHALRTCVYEKAQAAARRGELKIVH